MNPAGQPFDTGPGGPIGIRVEIMLDPSGNDWTDITPYVYYRDRIRITRGRPDETSGAQPQTCTLTLNNRDGRFTPKNPLGPYYGVLGRNTAIRVSRLVNGSNDPWYRFYGEVPSWPTTWDISGSDVYTQIQASGILRRLNQGNVPEGSAMRRAYTLSAGVSSAVAYWPCEDGQTATSLASALAWPTGTALTLSGQAPPSLSNFTGFLCSDSLPLLSASIWNGAIPADPFNGTDNVLRFLLAVPATGAFDTAVIARLFTSGRVARLDLQYGSASNGSLQISGYSVSGTLLFSSGYVGFAVNGKLLRVSMELITSGANITWATTVLSPGASGALSASGTLTSSATGSAYGVVINPDGHINDTAIGHVSYQSVWDSLFNLAQPLNAWIGEATADRFVRLNFEEPGVSASAALTGSVFDDSVTMGYQLSDTFTNLVQQVVDTDGGILFEARDQAELVLRKRVSLYNQSPQLTLDVSAHQLSAPLAPLDDDRFTRNDITVSRINGSSARQALTSGAMSTQSPPSGVGPYPNGVSISVGGDAQLTDQAGWRLLLGTVDEPRYPSISLNLRHPTFTSNPALLVAALTMDIGDRVAVLNLPGWLPPDPISQVLQGYSETLGVFEHDMALNCSPEAPYRIAVLDDSVLGRLDTDGSHLAANYGPTDTTLVVTTAGAAFGNSPLWTTSAGDFPFDIAVGGERMTVTNIVASTPPYHQIFTVIRSVNGVVKSQATFTDVRLWQPMVLSL
ncbi:conserved hypothetical protein [Catenulispora acidiphila DSM 44928]|uniref:Uncharacterized protein n=1 Tax=Catenulispora acidiphila (strain DSM 44928 / JCM 14897 / NBRC 102108 / NRRL B-24433 / ID139908) TaxID=479433 RepID=C7Q169_CATAD|nr:hypothetical protein [Catenulispora acidiphila]ACU71744.1 conserved hypothetical protein [Catenulispora acidiphila DSM 44928]